MLCCQICLGVVGACFGTNTIPTNTQGYRQWIQNLVPNGKAIHHFGFAVICWALWKCRNKVVFEKKLIKHPAEIALHACAFMSYWAGLFTLELQVNVAAGVDTILAIAHRLLKKRPDIRRLPAGDDFHPEDTDET
jgi:hypothetical protein